MNIKFLINLNIKYIKFLINLNIKFLINYKINIMEDIISNIILKQNKDLLHKIAEDT